MAEKILSVPYKSQWDQDAGKTANDCGPTSIAMALNYQGNAFTTDQVFNKTGAGQGLITITQMMNAIRAFGYDCEYRENCTPDDIKNYINQDTPPIALVHYGSLNSTQDKTFKGGHFFLVVGYRDDCYFVNDPNFKNPLRNDGDHHSFTKTEFEKAWRDCSIDKNPVNALLIIKKKNAPQPVTQSDLDKCRIDRDDHWNDLQAIKNALVVPGQYSKTVVLARIDSLVSIEGQQRDKDNQLNEAKKQISDLQSVSDGLKADNQGLQASLDSLKTELNKKVAELEMDLQTKNVQISSLQGELQSLKENVSVPSMSPWEKILSGVKDLIKGR